MWNNPYELTITHPGKPCTFYITETAPVKTDVPEDGLPYRIADCDTLPAKFIKPAIVSVEFPYADRKLCEDLYGDTVLLDLDYAPGIQYVYDSLENVEEVMFFFYWAESEAPSFRGYHLPDVKDTVELYKTKRIGQYFEEYDVVAEAMFRVVLGYDTAHDPTCTLVSEIFDYIDVEKWCKDNLWFLDRYNSKESSLGICDYDGIYYLFSRDRRTRHLH